MSKYVIADIDNAVNEGRNIQLEVAMRRIIKYITETIDAKFCAEDFKEWYNSDSEKPFVCNNNRYHWS